MLCPKCQNAMRTFDKSGVHIDQCESCHGIFLDRGELEQILSAENSFYGAGAAPPPYQPGGAAQQQHGHSDSPRPYRGGHPDSPRGYRGGRPDSPSPFGGHRGGYEDSPRPYGGHHGEHHGGHPRKRKSFLEQLFD